ncbi:MAG: radical SAM protein [Methanobacteriota archaeon]
MDGPSQGKKSLVNNVRVAFGTGVVLGLWHGQLIEPPTTAHFFAYYDGRCSGNCKFCPQARESTADLKMLSRVIWPKFELKKVLAALDANSNQFQRVCIQAVNFPGAVDVICELASNVKDVCKLPMTVSCQPLTIDDMNRLVDVGVERVGVALDAATKEIFFNVKGNEYVWDKHLKALENAKSIFGDKVSTHLIVGLGESEEDMVRTVQLLHDRGITIGLFAFTPIVGTQLSKRPRPDVASYRRIQLARFLIVENMSNAERMGFEGSQIASFGVDVDVLKKTIESGEPFRTSGCPGCNRPFYNESPRGPIYNYPRKPKRKNIDEIQTALNLAT